MKSECNLIWFFCRQVLIFLPALPPLPQTCWTLVGFFPNPWNQKRKYSTCRVFVLSKMRLPFLFEELSVQMAVFFYYIFNYCCFVLVSLLEKLVIPKWVSVICSPYYSVLSGHFYLSPYSLRSERTPHLCPPNSTHRFSAVRFCSFLLPMFLKILITLFTSHHYSLNSASFLLVLICFLLHIPLLTSERPGFNDLLEVQDSHNLLLVPRANPFRGNVLPVWAFFVCSLSVSGSVHRLHVYFRSSLDLVFSYSWVSYPGAP